MDRNILRVVEKLEQLPEVRQGKAAAFVRQRMGDAASLLSRRGYIAAQVLRCNEALQRLIALCYEVEHNRLINVDSVTGRLRIGAPMGDDGWRHYGLRRSEARIMRHILFDRQAQWQPSQRPPLFMYERFRWYINLFDYGSIEHAQWWLQHSQITVSEWLQHAEQHADQYAG
jgi:hypothetical protein